MPPDLDFGPFLVLSEEARSALASAVQPLEFRAGATVVREGDPPEDAYAILTGRVRVVAGEHLRTLATMDAPALVGEMSVLSGEPRSATVLAAAPLRALRIPASALREAIGSSDAFASELEAFAAARAGNNFLRRSSPFADLPSAAIEALAAKIRPAEFAAGDLLFNQGERGDDVFLLRSGQVEVMRGASGAERRIGALGPGAFVGEVAALTGAPRSASVRAVSKVRAFRLAAEDVRPIVKQYRTALGRFETAMQARHSPRRLGDPHGVEAPDDPGAVVLRDEQRGTYLRLTKDALAIYEDLDGDRTLRDLSLRHFQRTGALDPQGVFATVAALQTAGFATAPRVASDAPDARLLRVADLFLAPRVELRDADALATALYRLLGWSFNRVGAAFAVGIGIIGLAALANVFRQSSPGDFGVGGLAVAFLGLFLAGVGHEAAHAVATKAAGRRVGRAGIGLLWFAPVIYVDTSDVWLIDRRRRAVVNAVGPLFNFALAGLLGLVAFFARGPIQDIAVWLSVVNLISVVFNLSPLLEFDGYYVLSDLANVNALRRKALRFVFHDVARRPRRPATRLEAGFIAYVLAVVAYVLGVTILVLLGVPKFVDGVLASRVGPELRLIAGTVLALGLATTQLMPFVGEVLAAGNEEAAG